MSSVLDKRLLVVSGKGGVGKSTVAAALAVTAARRGQRVALVEVGADESLTPLFGAKRRAGYRGLKVWGVKSKKKNAAGAVYTMRIDPEHAMREFVIRQIKVEAVYRAVFQNKVMRYFTAAAPGLQDLLVLGKIVYLAQEERARGNKLKWDVVILDAPATGHGVAFFNAAYAFLQISKVGPMRKRVQGVWDFLCDPEKTAFNVVSIPEEMPVNESVDLAALFDDLGLPAGTVFANAVYPELFESDQRALIEKMAAARRPDGVNGQVASALLSAATDQMHRQQSQAGYVDELAESLGWPLVSLPYLFRAEFGVEEIEALADCMGDV